MCRGRTEKSHSNMFTSAVILPFSWYFASNYMNYSGFWFNVFVINIFRIGILTHVSFSFLFSRSCLFSLSLAQSLVFQHQILYPDTVKEALSMVFDLAHYDFEHIYIHIKLSKTVRNHYRMQRIQDTFIQLSYEQNWSHTCRSLQFGNTKCQQQQRQQQQQ